MKAEEFDARFDQGEDVTGNLNLAKARVPDLNNAGSTSTFPHG